MKTLLASLVLLFGATTFSWGCTEGDTSCVSGNQYKCSCNTLSNGQKICAMGATGTKCSSFTVPYTPRPQLQNIKYDNSLDVVR